MVFDLEGVNLAPHQHLEADLFGRHEVATEAVARAADHRTEVAIFGFDLFERIDGVGASEHSRDLLVTGFEHVDHESASFNDKVEQVRKRIEKADHHRGVTLGD